MNKQQDIDLGLGFAAPAKKHQHLIFKLTVALSSYLYMTNHEIYFGVGLEGAKGRIPNMSIWDIISGDPVVIIEVVRNDTFDRSFNTSIESMVNYSSIQEAFIFNYSTNSWTRIARHNKRSPFKCLSADKSVTAKYLEKYNDKYKTKIEGYRAENADSSLCETLYIKFGSINMD